MPSLCPEEPDRAVGPTRLPWLQLSPCDLDTPTQEAKWVTFPTLALRRSSCLLSKELAACFRGSLSLFSGIRYLHSMPSAACFLWTHCLIWAEGTPLSAFYGACCVLSMGFAAFHRNHSPHRMNPLPTFCWPNHPTATRLDKISVRFHPHAMLSLSTLPPRPRGECGRRRTIHCSLRDPPPAF